MELTYVTSGESHGPGITAVVSGLPAGLALDREAIRTDLGRRQAGYGRSPRQKIETDDIEILGGVRHGLTLGGPLALIVRNRDHANWGAAMSAWPVTEEELAEVAARRSRKVQLPRPGHADLSGVMKYGLDDVRNVLERASAPETSARVAVGAITKGLLALLGIGVSGRVLAVGDVAAEPDAGDEEAFARARSSEIGCSDPAAEKRMLAAIDQAAADRDTLGGIIEIRAFGCPPGLGSHTEPRLRLDARLAAAAVSIQAMKGVEIGDAFANALLPGSAVHDELQYDDARGYWRETNRAGGVEGGMSNGEPVVVRVAMKPLPTLMRPLRSARLDTHEAADALVERSDTTAIAAAAVVGEAVVAFELARCVREKFGGDHVDDLIAAHAHYLERIPWHPTLDALERPIAVAGFMGAGKTTVGRLLAQRLGRPFADADAEVERRAGCSVRALFERDGEAAFRALEETVTRDLLQRGDAPVIALGGGALTSDATRALVRERAFCAWLDVPFATAWERVEGAPGARPLAGDRQAFEHLGARRAAHYTAAADAIVSGEDPAGAAAGALAQQVWTRPGLAQLALGLGAVAIVDDALELPRTAADIGIEGGEAAKSLAGLERVWRALAACELERSDVIVCAGGGSVTDVGGFAAATFRRGVPWVAVPSTLVGQVDAAIGGKTAINVAAKNDVGAFWQPAAVLCDPELLATLPPREWAGGMAEVIKTALLAGGRLWELVERWEPGIGDVAQRSELVQRCAGVKTLVVAGDPEDRGRRAILNLGHTIGHGVESVAGYGGLSHGECVAIGLVAALRLSEELAGLAAGTAEETARLLERHGLPVRAPGLDPEAVLGAMRHDKKRTAGTHRMVLLEAIGRPVFGVAVGEDVLADAVRRATAAD